MKNLTNTSNNAARRGFAVLLLWSLIFPVLFAQSTWTGGAGTTNWNTPGNWTGGVPSAGKTVTIYTCTTCPVITTMGNQAKFVQVYAGGKLTIGTNGGLTISNPGGPGMKTHATSQVNISLGSSLTIQNFWGEGLAIGGAFNNNGTVAINGGHTGIAVSAGATLSNAGSINVTGSSLNYALTSSGTVLNNGSLTLDDANKDGINMPIGTFTNGQNGTLNITKTSVNAIFTKGTFNNNGILNIDKGLNGIYLLYGTFNNNATGKLSIGSTAFLNTGIYVDPGTFKNAGELTIQNAQSKGMEISSGSVFNNFNKITLNVPAWAGIFNVGGSNFTNKPCALIESNAAIVNYATFTNNGVVKETSTGSSQIGMNNGTVLNLNGGTFSTSGGNPVIFDNINVWTGCTSTAWDNPKNWLPGTVPTAVTPNSAIVQNVAQASGNAPVVSTPASAAWLTLDKNATLTIASGGALSVGTYEPFYSTFYIRTGANLEVLAGGSFGATSINLSGSVQNSGSFTIVAPFHSVGGITMDGGTFTNNVGSQFIGQMGYYGAGVNVNMSNGASFSNNGLVSIGGFGGFSLSQSTLMNKPGSSMVLGSGSGQGSITNSNGSTFLNQGSLASGDLKTYNSSFTNNGSVQLGSKIPGLYGENATYSNTGTINLASANLVVYGGTFNNAGGINIQASPNDALVSSSTFTNNPSGNISINQTSTYGLLNLFVFKNQGNFNISNTSFEGLNNLGTFENLASGIVTVQQNLPSPWPGIANGALFTNSGTLNFLGNNLSSMINYSSGNFTNRPCAVVNATGLIHNQNNFKNEGLLTNSFVGTNINIGTFTNTGIIEDFNNAFGGVLFTNSAIRVRPISGTIGGIISNALEIGGMPPFQIGTTWYKNANLTDPAGSYVNGLNTFTPTVGVGTHTLYFTAKDLVNNCTKTVSIKVSIASPLIGFAGKEDSKILLTNAPNPFSDRTQIKVSLPVDTEAKLVVYDNFGRLVEVIYEGEIIKDELYQFDFNAADKRVGNYMATLILKNGRAFTLQLVKADNR